MKGLEHGFYFLAGVILLIVIGCTDVRPVQPSVGPFRGTTQFTGDLSNADISITDWKVLATVGVLGLGTVAGFIFIAYRLAAHHAALASTITSGLSKPSTA